jgi:hypothetical protein
VAITHGYCTLAQIKDYLSVTDTQDDALLEAAVTAASREIDRHCQRRFWSDTSTSARVYHVCDKDELVVDDFSTTTGLTVYTDEGDNGTYNQAWTITTDFVVYPFNGVLDGVEGWPFYEIRATGSRAFPTVSTGYGNRPRVQVTAKWGWAAVPDAVYQACLIKAAALYFRKDSPTGVMGGFTDLGPLRVSSREDPTVAMLLAPYVKPVVGQ